MEVRIRPTLTLQDYTAFNFFALRKRLILMPVLLLVLFPALTLVIALLNNDPAWLGMLLLTLFIGAVFAGLIALVNFVSIRSASKKQYRSSKAMQAESELLVDDAGLRDSNDFGSTIVAWENALRAEESSGTYYVFFSRMQAIAIPKRFLSPGEEETLRTLIQQHLPREKNKLARRG